MPKFKVGDVVRVLPKHLWTEIDKAPKVDPRGNMYAYCGRVFVIYYVNAHSNMYYLKDIDVRTYTGVSEWTWAERWLVKASYEGVSLYE